MAEACVAHAKEHWSTDLDYSARSLEDVELILARMHEKIPQNWMESIFKPKISDEQIAAMSLLYGSYLGEVMRRQWGGTWYETTDPDGRKSLTLELGAGRKVFPAGKVWKRLKDGEGDNVWVFYQMMEKLIAADHAGI